MLVDTWQLQIQIRWCLFKIKYFILFVYKIKCYFWLINWLTCISRTLIYKLKLSETKSGRHMLHVVPSAVCSEHCEVNNHPDLLTGYYMQTLNHSTELSCSGVYSSDSNARKCIEHQTTTDFGFSYPSWCTWLYFVAFNNTNK